ncbi:hypothetical protein V1477_004142 [Vespula maculifrons]|uniref:Uncharacterized protein n=3 Tax=Vespula TaxID=7451 RepID=A0A834JHB0_VESGE|nr:hypothetical protein HZH68_012766 [Vespula germanica]KAF7409071.1 hypothetical protein H0235_013923 [Vespula pensylvanica]
MSQSVKSEIKQRQAGVLYENSYQEENGWVKKELYGGRAIRNRTVLRFSLVAATIYSSAVLSRILTVSRANTYILLVVPITTALPHRNASSWLAELS